MIQPPKYRKRSDEFLNDRLRKALNTLNLRDWMVELFTDDDIPERFFDDDAGDSPAMVVHESQYKIARIWVSPGRAKRDNVDPLFYLLHEVGHIWQDNHTEEFKCNTIASLLLK